MLTAVRGKLQALINHQGFRRYAANTSWMMAEKMLRIAAGLLVGIWVARYLGPEQFGLFSYVLAFSAIFGSIAKLGLDGILVRELVNQPTLQAVYLGTAFWLKLIGALIVIALMAIASFFSSSDSTTNLFILIVATGFFFQSFEVIEFYFQSQVLAKVIAICKVVQLAISSLIKIYLVLTQAELVAFVFVAALDTLSLAVSYAVAYRLRKNPGFYRYFNFSIAGKLLKDSWPMVLGGLALMIQARIDQVMLQEFKGSEEVGYYSVAMRLIEIFTIAPVIIKNSLYPAIQRSKNHSFLLYMERLSNFYKLNFIIFIIFFIPIFIFSEGAVVFLYGEEYQPAGALLALFSVRLFFTNMGVARGVFLLVENLMRYSLLTMVLGTVVNIIMNYVLIPEYGAKGAIFATICSFSVTVFIVDAFYSKTRSNVFLQLKSILKFYTVKVK